MTKINANKAGLAGGIFLSLFHAVWALSIAVIPGVMQGFIDWVFNIHFLEPVWKITAFNLLNAVFLVVLTFVAGYIIGWVLAWVCNFVRKK